ncbi:MAG: site-2 protease family protein [Myxococcales bacterium]|nr:site-2 protease family protein [Myxococcales bacterium]
MLLVPLLLSLTVHEWAHAWSAYRLGDDTASRLGRLTLNPLAHMDPIGTFLLPLLGVPFGWAKPVPVNPARFRRDVSMTTGMAITAAAGPISNVVLAVLSTVVYGLMFRFSRGLATEGGAALLLTALIQVNVVLALFNLLPVPPLDGSRVVEAFLPLRLREGWAQVSRYAPFALLAVMLYGGVILDAPLRLASGLLQQLLVAVAT